MEVIVLGLICGIPVIAAAIIVPVVLLLSSTRKPKDPADKHDIGGEG